MKLTLAQICLIYNTDKNAYHSYIEEIYENLFKDIRYSAKKVLEIGVDFGSSLFMWREYFENAQITGIDTKFCPQVIDRERISFINESAYSFEMLNSLPNDFDVIIDDGPHTLETMVFTATEYVKKINRNGILVLEDFQDFNWTNIVKRLVPEGYEVKVSDLRKVRHRYDDIAMIITRA
jgi:hypothetical protein